MLSMSYQIHRVCCCLAIVREQIGTFELSLIRAPTRSTTVEPHLHKALGAKRSRFKRSETKSKSQLWRPQASSEGKHTGEMASWLKKM